jgi:hypothetical protein
MAHCESVRCGRPLGVTCLCPCKGCSPRPHRVVAAHTRAYAAETRIDDPPWRVGRTLGRTLYFRGVCVGMVDSKEIARDIVNVMNAIGICADCKIRVEPGRNYCTRCVDAGLHGWPKDFIRSLIRIRK